MEDVDVFYQNYQMYTLMYELLRFYLPKNALGPRSLPKEVFDWNHCVAYTIESSVKNPTNLLLYIACMSHLLSLLCFLFSISDLDIWVQRLPDDSGATAVPCKPQALGTTIRAAESNNYSFGRQCVADTDV